MLVGETIAQTADRLTFPRYRFLRPKAIAAIAYLDFDCYFAVVECVTFIAVSHPVGSIKTAKNLVALLRWVFWTVRKKLSRKDRALNSP
jgi:hypothetical protein